MLDREAEKVDIGHLAMAWRRFDLEELGVPQRDVVRPECVPAAAAEDPEPFEDVCWRRGCLRVGRMRQHAEEPVLSQRAGRPADAALLCKPAVGRLVVYVLGVEEGDEDVDIEERHAAHGSSRRRLTRAMVGFGLPAGRRGRRGTPLRTSAGSAGSRAVRARSESTLPAVEPRLEAISLIAARMSSSMSNVVRISWSIAHQASDVNVGLAGPSARYRPVFTELV